MESAEILGSKARIKILRLLSSRDMYVSELMEKGGMDGKTASHHLDILESEGIVTSYKDGRRRYYRLIREVRMRISPSPNRRFLIHFPRIDDDA